MPSKKDLIEEHKRLIPLLREGTKEEREAEAADQAKELAEMQKEEHSGIKIDCSHHVPYLGGTSKDGKIVYIDKRFPKHIKSQDGRIIDAHKYLVIHEVTEKRLLDLGKEYNDAHNIAEATEEAALRLDGFEPRDYYGVMYETYNHTLRDFDPGMVPKDLNMKPYIDDKLRSVIDRVKHRDLIKFDKNGQWRLVR